MILHHTGTFFLTSLYLILQGQGWILKMAKRFILSGTHKCASK
jgi:hypothetical protein